MEKRISDTHSEVIYTSKEITPEQSSLLDGNNPHRYPTEQELSADKVTESSGKTNISGEIGRIGRKCSNEERGVESKNECSDPPTA